MTPEPFDPDSATPERRQELARSMLVWAINAYEMTQHQWTIVRESYPLQAKPRWPEGDEDYREHKRWMALLKEADEAFDAAELILAQRIQVLYDDLAGPGRGTEDEPSESFVSRAVRHNGSVYVLAFDVNLCEPGKNVIAVYPDRLVIDLALGR